MKANILISPNDTIQIKENLEHIHGNFPEFFQLKTIDEGSDVSIGNGVYIHTRNTVEGSWNLITINK